MVTRPGFVDVGNDTDLAFTGHHDVRAGRPSLGPGAIGGPRTLRPIATAMGTSRPEKECLGRTLAPSSPALICGGRPTATFPDPENRSWWSRALFKFTKLRTILEFDNWLSSVSYFACGCALFVFERKTRRPLG